jgi:hypothetical protein
MLTPMIWNSDSASIAGAKAQPTIARPSLRAALPNVVW